VRTVVVTLIGAFAFCLALIPGAIGAGPCEISATLGRTAATGGTRQVRVTRQIDVKISTNEKCRLLKYLIFGGISVG
jgi:hypothetical protein